MRSILALLVTLILSPIFGQTHTVLAAQAIKPFPVAPHNNTSIEWWYLFAHLTTKSNRHEAVVISFFRFANLGTQDDSAQPAPSAQQEHYLICGVTDEDTGKHQNFSLADKNTELMMQSMAALAMLAGRNRSHQQAMIDLAAKGEFPPPTKLISGNCDVIGSTHFNAQFGNVATLKSHPGVLNSYTLTFSQPGKANFSLTFTGQKTPMYVGGDGNTGVVRPDDMKYVSLTRCSVSGQISVNGIMESASGDGWFDHQWGSSWTPTAVGWDWFGIQLDDGRDILVFRQRYLADGSVFGAMATIEDKTGKLTVTRNVIFKADPRSIWASSKTGVNYPLGWNISLPDQHQDITVFTKVKDQELAALGNTGGAIWEGTVDVSAFPALPAGIVTDMPIVVTHGKGYMELVGYGDPTVAATLPPK